MRDLLLLSTSTIHGSEFLEYCLETVAEHFKGIDELIFVPYARPSGISHEEYTQLVAEKMSKIGIAVKGMHEIEDPLAAFERFKGIYIGGGNTFLLTKTLYERRFMEAIRQKVLSGDMKYMGSSAGTNVACRTINNTNDMPIVYPPSFEAMSLVPFNINPHYLDPDPDSTHKGETRETRIKEFHFQDEIPVLGLREGSWLKVKGDEINLGGSHTARLFEKGKEPREVSTADDLTFLLKP